MSTKLVACMCGLALGALGSGCGGDDDSPAADASTADAATGADAAEGEADAAVDTEPTVSAEMLVNAQIADVAVAPDGSTYLVGTLGAPYDFGNGTVTPGGDLDVLVVRYDPTGALDWVKQYGSDDYNLARAVAVDDDGNVYVTGYVRSSVDFGGGPEHPDPATGADLFIASFAPSGAYRWAEVYASDGGSLDDGTGIAVGADKVYVTGSVGRIMDLGGGTLGNLSDSYYFFSAAFDRDTGSHIWSQGFAFATADNHYLVATDLVIDSQENLYVSGWFRGTVDLGNGSIASSETSPGIDSPTGFVVSYGSGGAFRWLKRQDGDYHDQTHALDVDADDNVYAAGYYSRMAEVGGGTLNDSESNSGNHHLFVVSYSSAGSYRFDSAGLTPAGESGSRSEARGVAVIGSSVLVSFNFGGSIEAAGEPMESTPSDANPDYGSEDVGLIGLDRQSGDVLWTRHYGAGGDDGVGRVESDGSTALTVVRPEGVIDVEGTNIEPQGMNTAVLLRVSP